MARVNRAFVQQFADNLSALSDNARKNLVEQLSRADIEDYQDVAGIMRFICAPYTDMSAAITADFYNTIRREAKAAGSYTAVAESGYDEEALTRASYAVQREVLGGTATAPLDKLLGDVIDRNIMDASNNCVRHNARRDPAKPRYASVPTSTSPCAFCVMRASAGFVYTDEKSVLHSHHACRCIAVPGFEGSTEVEGYDADAYYAEYAEARDALNSGDIPDEMKERFAEERAAKGKDYDKTNEILAVMRYQQGIS